MSLDTGQWTLTRDVAGALLFGQAVMIAMDCMSTLNSSPWTSETFGASPEKAKSSREYVMHSVAVSAGLSICSAAIAESWWPVVGIAVTDVYLTWIYNRALARGASSGSTGWGQ